MRQIYSRMLLALCASILVCTPVGAAKVKHRETIYNASAEMALSFPEGVGCGADSFVVADTGNSQVVKFNISAQTIAAEAVFPLPKTSPLAAQLAADGTIFVLDGRTRTILKITPQGQVVGKFEPKGVPSPQRIVPRSFKIAQDGNIYLLDVFGERVLILDAGQAFLREIQFPEEYGFFSDLAVNSQGSVFILDSVAGEIFTAEGENETFELFSSNLEEYMNFPISLALDSNGVIYVSDQNGSGLAQIGRDGSFQGRKFGMGWEDGQLYYPGQVCINSDGNLIVADRNNSRIQVFEILSE